jgi:hypothetical protein
VKLRKDTLDEYGHEHNATGEFTGPYAGQELNVANLYHDAGQLFGDYKKHVQSHEHGMVNASVEPPQANPMRRVVNAAQDLASNAVGWSPDPAHAQDAQPHMAYEAQTCPTCTHKYQAFLQAWRNAERQDPRIREHPEDKLGDTLSEFTGEGILAARRAFNLIKRP